MEKIRAIGRALQNPRVAGKGDGATTTAVSMASTVGTWIALTTMPRSSPNGSGNHHHMHDASPTKEPVVTTQPSCQNFTFVQLLHLTDTMACTPYSGTYLNGKIPLGAGQGPWYLTMNKCTKVHSIME